MALFRRRSAPEPSTLPSVHHVDGHVVRELEKAEHRQFTGRIDVIDRATHGRGQVFCFRGRPYAVALQGFTPDVAARLAASGRLDAEAAADLPRGPDAGRVAVERGWITAEGLAIVHQEIVSAGLGALSLCSHPRVDQVADEVTDAYCALPEPVEDLFGALQARDERLQRTWAGLARDGDPATTGFVATGAPVPQALQRPEVNALLDGLNAPACIDAAAERAGFTRAEAVHLAGMLAASGVLQLDPAPVLPPPSDRLRVPEEFGRRRVDASMPGS